MWLSLLGLIPNAFKTINGITTAISNERIKKITAHTEEQKIKADENIKHLEAIRDVRMSKIENPLTALVMFGYGVGPLFILSKIFIWDKVIGSFAGCAGINGNLPGCETFRTDPLDPNLWWVVTAQIAFYFIAAKMTR